MTDLQAALTSEVDTSLARRRLGDFIALVEPSYQQTRHTKALCEALEAVERGDIKRLIVQMPPRHGKTMHVSWAFPAWVLGRHPKWQLVMASHKAELAEDNSSKAQSYIQDEAWPFECRVSGNSHASHRWHTDAGGLCIAVGWESGLTGRGADLLVIDDPIENQDAASSPRFRDRLWEWYSTSARTRLMPGARIIICMTRWHDDDLVGRILASDADRWKVISWPAIAGENDPLGRAPGEMLWPDRWPMEELPRVPAEMSSSSFASLYMQDPIPAGGATFRMEWFKRRYTFPPSGFTVMSMDCASKTGVSNDYSAMAVWRTDWRDYYLLDAWRGKVEFWQLKDAVIEKYRQHRPNLVVCEEASAGIGLIQELRQYTGIPILGVVPRGSKEARAEAVTPLFESGRVVLPEYAGWLDDWIAEHARFPASKFDDQVDCTSLGLAYLNKRFASRVAAGRFRQRMESTPLMGR
jgi:predicted phage terminase large subunit-like protein